MKSSALVALTALALAAGACQKPATAEPVAAAPIGEADDGKIADATVAVWTSMDAAKIKALYAPSIVAFDFAAGPLEADRATFDKAQDAYAAAKYDSSSQKARKIQILDADTFVMSGTWDIKSSATPANDATVRCTDVFEKDASGAWPIVNEHCSAVPKAV